MEVIVQTLFVLKEKTNLTLKQKEASYLDENYNLCLFLKKQGSKNCST